MKNDNETRRFVSGILTGRRLHMQDLDEALWERETSERLIRHGERYFVVELDDNGAFVDYNSIPYVTFDEASKHVNYRACRTEIRKGWITGETVCSITTLV